jgi:hypothetical protein
MRAGVGVTGMFCLGSRRGTHEVPPPCVDRSELPSPQVSGGIALLIDCEEEWILRGVLTGM